jgi:PhnB protein
MNAIQTYLSFDGNAREAMTFYAKALGAEYQEPSFSNAPKFGAGRVIHARVSKGSMAILASDTPEGMHPTQGDNFNVCVQCDDVPEIERLFKALGEGGKVTMPLENTFWGARFGMLTDKFGINWMFNCDLPKT